MTFEDAESSGARTKIVLGLIGSIISITMSVANPLILTLLMANAPPQDFMTILIQISIIFGIIGTITNIMLGIGFYGLSQRYHQQLFAIGGALLVLSPVVFLSISMMISLMGYGIMIIYDAFGAISVLILFVPLISIRDRSASSIVTLLAAIGIILSISGNIFHLIGVGLNGINPFSMIIVSIAIFSKVTILLFFYTEWMKQSNATSDLPDTW
ncbi:MAG: hypothetical protein ACTSYL_06450 [Candidatus Thorarchaeota archaeon]